MNDTMDLGKVDYDTVLEISDAKSASVFQDDLLKFLTRIDVVVPAELESEEVHEPTSKNIEHRKEAMPQDAAWPFQHVELLPAEVVLYGEFFDIDFEEENYFLSHRYSSLTGFGATLVEAQISLIERARILAEGFVNVPTDDFSEEAFQLRDLLLRII